MAVKVKKADAEKVLRLVKKAFKPWIAAGYEPKLIKDWDWPSGGPAPYAIVWEGGPYDWTYHFPFGGIEEEYGSKIADLSAEIPKNVFCEPYSGWALCIYDGRW